MTRETLSNDTMLFGWFWLLLTTVILAVCATIYLCIAPNGPEPAVGSEASLIKFFDEQDNRFNNLWRSAGSDEKTPLLKYREIIDDEKQMLLNAHLAFIKKYQTGEAEMIPSIKVVQSGKVSVKHDN